MIPYYLLEKTTIGPFTLYVWGIFAGLAFALALYIALKEGKRKGVSEDIIFDLGILFLFGGMFGARAAYVLENWNYYSEDISRVWKFSEGGLMFFGGAITATILVSAYIFWKKLNFWKVFDCLIPSFAIGEFISRIGCALGDLHVGAKTSLPWAQAYIDGSYRHPISIYMAFNGLLMFAVLWSVRKKIKINGALSLLFVVWYSGTRFLLDFLRCNDLQICDPRYYGYTPSQYLSAVAFIISLTYLIFLIKIRRTADKNNMAEQQNKSKESGEAQAAKNENLQGSIINYTEIEEVVIKSGDNEVENSGGFNSGNKQNLKEKIVILVKKPWAVAIIAAIALVLGSVGASYYYVKLYYGKMFSGSPFSYQGKSWVSYDDPIVNLTVINDPNCVLCDSEPMKEYLRTGLAPTLKINNVDIGSPEGKALADKFKIKYIPAFVFDSNVKNLNSLKKATPDELSQTFSIIDDRYLLKSAVLSSIASRMGIELGKYIVIPEIKADDRIKGSESAPVSIIEFSDFKCPYCKQENDIINQVLAAYPGKVKLVYKHFPLSIHPEAQFAAEAAECAGDQGKFFEMADVLFAKQDKLDTASISQYARNLKLDMVKFKSCTDSGKFKNKVASDAQTAADFGFGGTPAIFIGSEFFGGGVSLEQFKEVIDGQLSK